MAHIVFEKLLSVLLPLQLLLHGNDLAGKTFLAHSQVIDDQRQVLVDSTKVFELGAHFVCLLIQVLDLHFAGTNVSLEFLDLVVKNKFELFEFLYLFLEVKDAMFLFV